ncbi:hypothetical protein [Turicibacter sp. TJ11]|uniref:hypothetical protein n=1 Tax=Turicibacter sp. TJ11 TaxID=2806443 RepID=UPI001F3BB687|nr:hypothetical protein [Turicibacter sp. TJ11]
MITGKEVKRYEAADYDHVLDFMKRVTTLETVNDGIIEQSILIKESDKVTGMVSFESFDQIGMIRYFIYDQHIVPDLLVNMFFELYRCAKEKEINQLVAIASHPYARQLFEVLGFVEIKKTTDINVPDLLKDEEVQLMSIKF